MFMLIRESFLSPPLSGVVEVIRGGFPQGDKGVGFLLGEDRGVQVVVQVVNKGGEFLVSGWGGGEGVHKVFPFGSLLL